MMHEPEGLIRRQFDFLLSKRGADFFHELRRCLKVLQAEPRVAALLAELGDEARKLFKERGDQDKQNVARLIELKQELVRRAPEMPDDSDVPLPSEQDVSIRWWSTLPAFDAMASGARRSPYAKDDPLAPVLHKILAAKFHALQFPPSTDSAPRAPLRQDLDDLGDRLLHLSQDMGHADRIFQGEWMTSPGAALLLLTATLDDLNPAPQHLSGREAMLAVVSRFVKEFQTGAGEFREQVYGKPSPNLDAVATRFLPLVERLYQGLLLKVGTRRSAIALLRRFKTRCQTHDRKRMQELGADPNVIEPRLTSELALWLFDQGLNPLTEVPIAGLRLDLLDASKDPSASLYVEAKQYKDGDPIRQRIQRGMYQVYTSVGRLRGDQIDVTEAFLVIFRRSGALVHLPDEVPASDYVVFPIVIDIAPEELTGSRERAQPIEMTVEELRPAAVGLSPATPHSPAPPRKRRRARAGPLARRRS
jgi:hypothetical protein